MENVNKNLKAGIVGNSRMEGHQSASTNFGDFRVYQALGPLPVTRLSSVR